jgi:hypothetical protein
MLRSAGGGNFLVTEQEVMKRIHSGVTVTDLTIRLHDVKIPTDNLVKLIHKLKDEGKITLESTQLASTNPEKEGAGTFQTLIKKVEKK